MYILKYVEFPYTFKVKLYYTGSCEVIKNKNDTKAISFLQFRNDKYRAF